MAVPDGRALHAELIVLVGALSAFAPLSIDMYLPGLPAVARDLGASASEVQLTLTACLVGLALGQLVAGPMSDALGRRRPLLVGLAGYAIASALCAIAPDVWSFALLRVAQGLAGAAGIVIARAVVRDHFVGVAAARFFALTMLVNGLAPILAPIIGGQLLLVTAWRGIFMVLAAIGATLFLSAAIRLRESLPIERRRTGGVGESLRSFRGLVGDRVFVGYTLSSALAFAAMFCYISGSPFVVEEIYGASPQMFSLIFGANALGIVVAGQISGVLVGRVDPRRILGIGLAGSASGGALLLAAVVSGIGLAGILPAFFLVVASLGFILPNATALAMADHPHQAGSASALIGATQFLVGATAAPLVGVAGSSTAMPMAITIACLGSAALTTFVVLTRRPGHVVPAR